MTRGEFIRAAGSAAVLAVAGDSFGADGSAAAVDYAALQKEIDGVTPKMFADYLEGKGAEHPVFRRLDDAFDKVVREVRETVVTDKPAVWLVYNMGVVVKTKEACFSVDLKHRKAPELAPLLDFALITHNHDDHYTEPFYQAMNGAGKVVISNFKDNYGATVWKSGGYTRSPRVFKLKDVEIRTSVSDHNDYLVAFTMPFEIRVGETVIYHTGDSSTLGQLNPTSAPDLWIVHPYCGIKCEEGFRKFRAKRTAVAHLNEIGHAKGRWRWSWQQGLAVKSAVEKAGGAAIVPVWGDRIF